MSQSLWKCSACGAVLVDAKPNAVQFHRDKHIYAVVIEKDRRKVPTKRGRRK